MKKLHLIYCIGLLSFLLGIHEGRIAVWKDKESEPLKVFPYYASMLPEADRKALEEGIFIPDDHRLHAMIEDYLS